MRMLAIIVVAGACGNPARAARDAATGTDAAVDARRVLADAPPDAYVPRWSAPVELDTGMTVSGASVVMETDGDALAIWKQGSTGTSDLYASRYVHAVGWNLPEPAEQLSGQVGSAALAIDHGDNAFAVWAGFGTGVTDVWTNQHTAAGWGTAAAIGTSVADGFPSNTTTAAVNTLGTAVAAWTHFDGARTSLYGNTRLPNGTWGTAQLLESDSAGDVSHPASVVLANGNAVIVWEQSDGTRLNMWSATYDFGTGWGGAHLLESDDTGDVGAPAIATDNANRAIAVWQQNNGIYACVVDVSAPQRIDGNVIGGHDPKIALDATGAGVAIWGHFDGQRNAIFAASLDVSGTWGAPAQISTTAETHDELEPDLAIDRASGEAVAAWVHFESSGIGTASFGATGWSAPTTIPTGPAIYPHVGIDSNHHAVAVWLTDHVWASVFR